MALDDEIRFRCSRSEREEAEALARRRGMTLSQLGRMALHQQIGRDSASAELDDLRAFVTGRVAAVFNEIAALRRQGVQLGPLQRRS